MSWSFQFAGKAASAHKAVEAHTATLGVAGEQEAYEAAKRAVLIAIAANDNEMGVNVSASGYASGPTPLNKRACQLSITLSNFVLVEG